MSLNMNRSANSENEYSTRALHRGDFDSAMIINMD